MQLRWWQVGTLLPLVMILLLVGDVLGRFLPLELIAFRAWEPALRTSPGGPGPFEPRKGIVTRRSYGDLASMGNVWNVRQYHEEDFQADRLGYRNSYDIDAVHYAGIVTGDSLVVATGVREPDTLPGQLSERAGARFYNAGGLAPMGENDLITLAAELRLARGVVVYELLERRARWGAPLRSDASIPTSAAPLAPSGQTAARVSPLRVISQRIVKRAQNGVLQPNPYAALALQFPLDNDEDMLFLPLDTDPVGNVEALSARWERYLTAYAKSVDEHGLKLVVLLVPNKYTVYGPLALDGPRSFEGERLLGRIQVALHAAGVPVVNVTPAFKTLAARELPHHQYLYWRDDTHWNASGISVAAGAVWEQIRSLGERQ